MRRTSQKSETLFCQHGRVFIEGNISGNVLCASKGFRKKELWYPLLFLVENCIFLWKWWESIIKYKDTLAFLLRFCDTLIETVGGYRFKVTIKTYPNIKKPWLKYLSLCSNLFLRFFIEIGNFEGWNSQDSAFPKNTHLKFEDRNGSADPKKYFSHGFLVNELNSICILYLKFSRVSTSVSQNCDILSHFLKLELSKQRYTSKIAVAMLFNSTNTMF